MQEVDVNCFILTTNWSEPAYFTASVNSWDLLTTALWNKLNWFIFFKFTFISSLNFLYSMYVHIHPSILPGSTQLCDLLKSKTNFPLPKCPWMCGLLPEHGLLTRGYILKRNCLSLFQQLAIVNYFMTRDRVLCPTLFSCWDLDWFGLAQVLCLLSQLLWVQQPCCVQKALLFL